MKNNLKEFNRPLLSEAEIERRHARILTAHKVMWAATALAVLALPLSEGEHGIGLVIAWLMKFGIWSLIGMVLSRMLDDIEATSTTTYLWLPLSCCNDMAALCEKEGSLLAYRDQVRALGRRFTLGEFNAMRTWLAAREAADWRAQYDDEQRAACQRLYGLPAADDAHA